MIEGPTPRPSCASAHTGTVVLAPSASVAMNMMAVDFCISSALLPGAFDACDANAPPAQPRDAGQAEPGSQNQNRRRRERVLGVAEMKPVLVDQLERNEECRAAQRQRVQREPKARGARPQRERRAAQHAEASDDDGGVERRVRWFSQPGEKREAVQGDAAAGDDGVATLVGGDAHFSETAPQHRDGRNGAAIAAYDSRTSA